MAQTAQTPHAGRAARAARDRIAVALHGTPPESALAALLALVATLARRHPETTGAGVRLCADIADEFEVPATPPLPLTQKGT